MDSENAPSIVIPLAIFIALLAACGVVAFVLTVVALIISIA